ncbi:MAG TPA: hypothetical protein VKC66_24775 [Xanthobacteraceae bacterium]|nr:hypothetical protein [Xanthobacteraceae bacterium]
MNRATVFRIVGFAFFAFAAVSIYRGEFVVGKVGGMVITRAHDPESFWRGIIIQIGAGCVLLYLSRSAPPRRIAHLTVGEAESAEERPKLPNYDPDFCGKVVKGAACVCVGLIIAELLVLLLVNPSDDRCPGWIFHPNQPSAASLWVLAGMCTGLPALWVCYVALRWDDYFARKMYDSIAYGPPEQLLIDGKWLVLMVMAGWCLFCAIPLLLMLGQCTALYDYLNAFHF